ncbi:cytochrome c oxidase subunit I, partial [mine drainage metagenome]
MDATTTYIVIGLISAFTAFAVIFLSYQGSWFVRKAKLWMFTTDHKRIGLMYIATGITFFFIGGIYAVLIRTDLGFVQGLGLDPQTTLGITPDVYST